MSLIWKRIRDNSGLFSDGSGQSCVYYRAGAYRIDPEISWRARAYDPKPRQWRVYYDPEITRHGGKDITLAYSLKEAKEKAEKHAAGVDDQTGI